MICPRLDRALEALHCGEAVEPHCLECLRALADEARFVSLVERGLAGVRPPIPIAPLVLERIAAEAAAARIRRRRRAATMAAAAAVVLAALSTAWVLRPRTAAVAPRGDGGGAGLREPRPVTRAGGDPDRRAAPDPAALPPAPAVPLQDMFSIVPEPAPAAPPAAKVPDPPTAGTGPEPGDGRILWIPGPDRGRPAKAVWVRGRLEPDGLRSVEVSDPSFFGLAEIAAVDHRLIVARPGLVLRFRYRLDRAAPALVQMWNATRRENFQAPLEGPAGAWADAVLRLADLPPGPGSRRGLTVGPGDVFSRITWFVGRPGREAEIRIRDLRVLEEAPAGR